MQGDKAHQHAALVAPSHRASAQQQSYGSTGTAPTLRTEAKYWALRTNLQPPYRILRARAGPQAGDKITGAAWEGRVVEVVGSIDKPQGHPVGLLTVRIQRGVETPQAATISDWTAGNPVITKGGREYRGNVPVAHPVVDTLVVAPPEAPPAATPQAPTTPAMSVLQALGGLGTMFRSKGVSNVREVNAALLAGTGDLSEVPGADKRLQAAVAQLEETLAPVVKIGLSPQGQDALKVVESAFPGTRAYIAGAPGSIFQALANGAANMAREKYPVSAYYRTCLTWAAGAHYMGGGWRGPPHQTWAYGRETSLREAGMGGPVTIEGGPSSHCDHDPMTCNCLGQDVSDRVLLFGMMADITPDTVAKWRTRWGKVLCIVPNPNFSFFTTRLAKTVRSIALPGDSVPIQLPANRWFGVVTSSELSRWFWQAQRTLVW